MPTTFVNTIDETEILAKRSQCDYAGNDIQTTYATKSELPTATSDLTNDSGFITGSDVPVKDVQVSGESVVNAQGIAEISIPQTGVLDVEVDGSSVVNAQGVAEIVLPTFTQVNADWNATSGVSEILNKPDLSIYAESSDLATVATTGSYDDLVDKPTIPSAQVNADWDATSGVSEILNKPNLATVATTGDYSDLQNLPSIPAAQVNSDWDATSGVSQILNKPTIPSYTAGNGIDVTNNVVSAKVDGTTIDTNASGELTVIGGGGGGGGVTDVEVDGVSVVNQGVAEITMPTVDQTYDGTSTNAQSGAAVAQAIATKEDAFDVGTGLEMDTSGATPTLQVEAPVDIVAGPGIVIDNPDGNTLRVSTDENYETVLWTGTLNTLNSNIECSENLSNFSTIKIFYRLVADSVVQSVGVHEFEPSEMTSNNVSFGAFYLISNNFYGWWLGRLVVTDGYKVKITNTRNSWGTGNSPSDGTQNRDTVGFIYKIVGIHRINGGN